MKQPHKYTDELNISEMLSDLEFTGTLPMNDQICESLHCYNSLYKKYIHPALLIGMSNITKSPSFHLKDGVAAVHTSDEVEFINPAEIGAELKVSWAVTHIYRRRDKYWNDKEYQVVEAVIVSGDKVILKRRMTDYFSRGKDVI